MKFRPGTIGGFIAGLVGQRTAVEYIRRGGGFLGNTLAVPVAVAATVGTVVAGRFIGGDMGRGLTGAGVVGGLYALADFGKFGEQFNDAAGLVTDTAKGFWNHLSATVNSGMSQIRANLGNPTRRTEPVGSSWFPRPDTTWDFVRTPGSGYTSGAGF